MNSIEIYKKYQESLYIQGANKIEKKFGKENKNSILIGLVTGFIISLFLISLEIFKWVFNVLNIYEYIVVVYLIYGIMFYVSAKEFVKVISK